MPTLRYSLLSSTLVVCVLLTGSVFEASAQETRLPSQVGPFSLTDTSRYERAELGIMYTYTSPEGVRANAYVYPVPRERLRAAEALRVAAEAKSFLATLTAGNERGLYDDVNVVVDEACLWETSDGSRPGHLVAAVVSRENGSFVSFMHLVLIGDHYVKTRLTMPAQQWRTSLAPNFGPDLFQMLGAEPPEHVGP
jgi:hypothetical protein